MKDCERGSCRQCSGWWDCCCLQSWLFTLSWMVVAASFAYFAYLHGHPVDRTDIIIHRYEVSDVPPAPPCCDGCCGKDCKCEHCNCASLASEPCEDESACTCNKSCVCGCQTHGCCACPREKDINIDIIIEEHGQKAPEVPLGAGGPAPPKKPKLTADTGLIPADECPKHDPPKKAKKPAPKQECPKD